MVCLDVVRPRRAEHVVIYRDDRQFAAWPFNVGVWKYRGDEIVVGYARRRCEYAEPWQVNHGYAPPEGGGGLYLARSTDGGVTWKERRFTETIDLAQRAQAGRLAAPQAPLDLRHPDLAIFHSGDAVILSLDRARSFPHGVRLPYAGHEKVMGRPDYVIRPDGACVLFSTVSTTTGVEGRPVCYISRNGGQSWEFFSYMSEEPRQHMVIMPSGVWLDSGRMIAAVRVQMQRHAFSFWSLVYASDDGGRTWGLLSRVNDLGAPCHLLLLDDGRVAATYGYRSRPFGIRARLSEDGGATWGAEIVLRDDGKSWDLGYPKTVQLDGGDLFTAYYFNAAEDPVSVDGGVRHIAGTRWTP